MNQNSNSTPPSSQDLAGSPSLKPSPMPPEQTGKKVAGRRKRVPIAFEDVVSPDVIRRFFSYVSKKKSGCWEWTGAKSINGYGITTVKNTKVAAHRVAFIMYGGSFTEEKCCACHYCDNPACVNPEHLWVGSNQDNSNDCVKKKRHVFGDRMWSVRFPEKLARGNKNGSHTHPEKRACGERHGSHTHPEKWKRGDKHYYRTNPEKVPRGETHPNAKLSNKDIDEIRSYAGKRVPYTKLKAKFGISNCHIWRIVTNQIRKTN